MIYRNSVIIKALLFVIGASGSFIAIAADNDKPALNSSELGSLVKALEAPRHQMELQLIDKTRTALAPYVDSGDYIVSVVIALSEKKIAEFAVGKTADIQFRLLPQTVKAEDSLRTMAASLSLDEFLQLSKKITVNLTISQQLSEDYLKSLPNLLLQELHLDAARGDVVVVGRSTIASQKLAQLRTEVSSLGQARDKALDERRKLEAESIKLQLGIQQTESQKNELEKKLTHSEERVQQLTKDLESKRRDIEEQRAKLQAAEEEANTVWGRVRHLVQGIEILVAAVLLVIVFVVLFVPVTILFFRGKRRQEDRIFEAIERVVGSFNRMSSNLSTPVGGNRLGLENSAPSNKQALPQPNSDTYAALGGSNVSDSERQEAEATWLQLQENHSVTLCVLYDWLTDTEGRERLLAVIDAIGSENATKLLAEFSRSERDAIGKQLDRPANKQLGYRTIMQLQRQVNFAITSRPAYFRSLDLGFVVKYSDEKVAEALAKLDIDAAASVLILLSAKRSSAVFPKLNGKLDTSQMLEKMSSLAGMTKEQADKALINFRRTLAVSEDKDDVFDVSVHLEALYAGGDAAIKSSVAKTIHGNKDLDARIGSNLLSFDDVLTLETEVLSELLAPLEPETLAALFLVLQEAQVAKLTPLLSERVQASVKEEMNRVEGRGTQKRRAMVLGNRIQAAILDQVKNLQAEGVVSIERNEADKRTEDKAS